MTRYVAWYNWAYGNEAIHIYRCWEKKMFYDIVMLPNLISYVLRFNNFYL